jgi:fatty acid desaturase
MMRVIATGRTYWTDDQLQGLYRQAHDFITANRLDKVSLTRTLRFCAATLVCFMAPPILYVLLPPLIGVPIAILVSLRALNSLSQITHTSVHGTLLRGVRGGTALGDLAAFALGYTQYIRKQTHLDHHRYLNTERDPDVTWGRPDQTTSELGRGLLQDLLGISVIRKLLQYYSVERKRFERRFDIGAIAKFVFGVIVAQALIAAYYWMVAGIGAYLILFILPMATIYPAMIRLRSFVEHSLESGAEGWMSRTIRPLLLERLVIAPGYQFYHFEHHAFPAIPPYHLPKLHEYLCQQGWIEAGRCGYVGYVLSKGWR